MSHITTRDLMRQVRSCQLGLEEEEAVLFLRALCQKLSSAHLSFASASATQLCYNVALNLLSKTDTEHGRLAATVHLAERVFDRTATREDRAKMASDVAFIRRHGLFCRVWPGEVTARRALAFFFPALA